VLIQTKEKSQQKIDMDRQHELLKLLLGPSKVEMTQQQTKVAQKAGQKPEPE